MRKRFNVAESLGCFDRLDIEGKEGTKETSQVYDLPLDFFY